MIELNQSAGFPVTNIKPFAKDIGFFTVSSDSRYCLCLSVSNDEMAVLDLENNLKTVNKWSYRFFDRMWDSVFKARVTSVTMVSPDLLVFYNEEGNFRFIDFSKKKQSSFNFLEQSHYLKHDFKPVDKREFLNICQGSKPQPIINFSSSIDETGYPTYHFVR